MKKLTTLACLFFVTQAVWATPEAYPGLVADAYHPLFKQPLKNKSNKLTLPLFNAEFTIPQGFEKNRSANGDISFEQHNEHGHINVTLGDNSIFGDWHHKGKDYRLTTDKSGSWLVELPTSHLIQDGCGTEHSPELHTQKSKNEKAAATTIDILVVHNNALAQRYPGDLMQTRVNHYMHVANQTLANSGLDLDVRLVGIEELPYNLNNSNNDMLKHMQSTISGSTIISGLENLPQLREATGADLIIAIRPHDIDTRGNCGLAYFPASNFNNSFGMNMVSDGMSSWSLCSDMVFIHEIGHNLGATHQYGQGGGTFQPQGSAFIKMFQFNTVMGSFGTGQNNRSKRLPVFSNPGINCGGYACGEVGGTEPSNNVAVINSTMNSVANYFPAISSAPQPADYQRSSRDIDGDGVTDWLDHFPFDPAETADADLDGFGDNIDAFPNDASEYADSDMDGTGNNTDSDDDNDGRSDANDTFPLDDSEQDDTDFDGYGDNSDAFPNNSAEHFDFDQDGMGDFNDRDDDNDGVVDLLDGVVGYMEDVLVINEEDNRILRFDAQTGRPMGIEVLPDDGLLTFQSDMTYDFEKHVLYYTSSSSVKMKNMMQREGSDILIPSYFDNTGAAAQVGTGFPTALFKPSSMPLLLSKIDRSSLSQYDIQNHNFVREIGDWVIPSQEESETIIDVEYNNEFYLLGVSGHIYRGSNANDFIQIDQNIGFREASDIAVHPDGSLLVSDFQKKQIIQVSASEGTRLGIFADLRALNLGRPSSLVVTKNNFLLVTTKDDNKIHRFDVLNGEYLGVLVDGLGLNGPNKMLLIPSLQDRFHHDVNQSFSPNPGMWFSPESSGRGFDIGVFGNRLQVIWFTYDSEGSPIWYYSAGKVEGMNYQSPLYQTHKLQENDTTFEEVGYVTLAFDDERNASVNWQIGSIEGEEHLNWHFFDANYSEQNHTGMWTRTDSPGWGVSVTTQGNKTVALSFLYDDTGAPRWVNSSTSTDTDILNFDVGAFFNNSLCPGCTDGNLEEVIVSGQMTFNFSEQPYWSSDMTWPMPLEGEWILNQTPLNRITSPPLRPR